MKTPTRSIVACAILACTNACTVNVKTPEVPDFAALEGATLEGMTRTDFEILMGGPQSKGVHLAGGVPLEMHFYYGMMGTMTIMPSQSAQLDSGMAFASFDGQELLTELVYFRSRFEGPKIRIGGKLPVTKVAESIELGTSSIGELEGLLGQPSYVGTRFNVVSGNTHQLSFFDSSKTEGSGLLRERWLLAGYDDSGTIQDLLWVSSYPEDLESLGEVQPQSLTSMTRLDMSSPYPVARTDSVSSSTKIDPVQVEALIRSAPDTIDGYTSVLGKPTAIGFKSFSEHEPWLLSHWSYIHTEYVGNESGASLKPTPAGARSTPVSYMVMKMETTRLMVAHTQDGVVREVIWLRPGGAKPEV